MAPKKAPKKAAKKTVGKSDTHKTAKDARRTFEHMGRVQALSSLTANESEALQLLSETADAAFRAQKYKASADLLRVAEHLSFASLHAEAEEQVATELKNALKEEFEHLLERAVEHSSHHELPKALVTLLSRLMKDSKAAFRRGSYRAALEFARGAEALSQVRDMNAKILPPPASQKRLKE